jgi:hypothetical protein
MSLSGCLTIGPSDRGIRSHERIAVHLLLRGRGGVIPL